MSPFYLVFDVNIWLFILHRGRSFNLSLPSAGLCARVCVFNNVEFRVTEGHVASIYPCWDVGSSSTDTRRDMKSPAIHKTVCFVLVLEVFFPLQNLKGNYLMNQVSIVFKG